MSKRRTPLTENIIWIPLTPSLVNHHHGKGIPSILDQDIGTDEEILELNGGFMDLARYCEMKHPVKCRNKAIRHDPSILRR